MMAPNTSSLAIILLLYGFLGKMAVDPVLISYVSDKADKKNLATTLGTLTSLECHHQLLLQQLQVLSWTKQVPEY